MSGRILEAVADEGIPMEPESQVTSLVLDDGGTTDLTESELIRRSQQGDRESFARLYNQYRSQVYALCLAQMRDPVAAEDVTQDTFERAYRAIDRFVPGKRLLPWLITIAANRCVSVHRMTRADPTDPTAEAWPERSRGDETAEAVLREERRVALERALTMIPPRQRRALMLHAVEGWNYTDIATAEGASLTSVKSLIFRARVRLRELCASSLPAMWFWPLRAERRGVPRISRVRFNTLRGHEFALSALGREFMNSLLPLVAALATLPVAGSPSTLGAPATASIGSVAHRTVGERRAPSSTLSASGSTWEPSDLTALAGEVTGRDQDVREPEDTRIRSVTMSPHFSEDRTVFAVGGARCNLTCAPVLFRSVDAGASWQTLRSEGLRGRTALLPSGFGRGDDRIFAMGEAGLQVSRDGGNSFDLAAPAGTLLLGTAAISPTFSTEDATILIGAQTLMEYDDRVRAISPSTYTSLPGPLEPAFSPRFAEDETLVVGGSRVEPRRGRVGVIYTCTGFVCRESVVPGALMQIRLAPDFGVGGLAVGFDAEHIYVGPDGRGNYRPVVAPARRITDVAAVGGETLIAAALDAHGSPGGVFVSRDAGRSWIRSESPLLDRGATALGAREQRIIVGTPSGVACSDDAGISWKTRCEV